MGIFDEEAKLDTVLIIDDENYVDRMRATFERRGIKAVHAKNGVEGLSLYRASKPCAVLLDYHLPDMNGIDVCKVLNSEEHQSKVYFISGSPPDMIKEKMKGLKISGFFSKPVNLLSIVNVLVPPKYD